MDRATSAHTLFCSRREELVTVETVRVRLCVCISAGCVSVHECVCERVCVHVCVQAPIIAYLFVKNKKYAPVLEVFKTPVSRLHYSRS